jgi:hypothetical protein
MIEVNTLSGEVADTGLELLVAADGDDVPVVVLLLEAVLDFVEDVVVEGLVLLGDEVAVDSVDVCAELGDSLFDSLLADVLV